MANQQHVDILFDEEEDAWNIWRQENPDIQPDLSAEELHMKYLKNVNLRGANLSGAKLIGEEFFGIDLKNANLSKVDLNQALLCGANLSETNLSEADLSNAYFTQFGNDPDHPELEAANLSGANLSKANLNGAVFGGANLRRANLREADLSGADLVGSDLSGTNLSGANLEAADLSDVDLSGADLSEANLTRATLVRTNMKSAILTACRIYGISAWDVELEGATLLNLIITPEGQSTITVDNLEVAQFIYLLLNNQKIRDVIDTITSKVVLILGRFTPERKIILDAIRDELRKRNYSPILFDFDKPASRDITETISTLAHLARFVIADITDAKSIPQELTLIVPNLPSVPVQPLILKAQHEYGMFEHFARYPWVLPVYRYQDEVSLLQSLKEEVIVPAEQKAQELAKQ
jgi:uncharacterized protein YjbI with pentapeptide repeats